MGHEPRTRRVYAGYLTAFLTFLARNPHLDHEQALLTFLRQEGRRSGPDTVRVKAYWVCRLAPQFSAWLPPTEAKVLWIYS